MKINKTQKNRILLLLFIALAIPIFALAQPACNPAGNNNIDSGEICDDNGGASVSDDIYAPVETPSGNVNIFETCAVFGQYIPASQGGPLNLEGPNGESGITCNTATCQPLLNCFEGLPQDNDPDSGECGDCRDCEGDSDSPYGTRCKRNECVNACPSFGNCHYTPGPGNSDDCSTCASIVDCTSYQNAADCERNVCVFNANVRNKVCEWAETGCRESLNCRWNCDGIYSNCQSDGFANRIGSCSPLAPNVGCVNPAILYPAKIYCANLEEEFPVFTWFNVIVSIFLLIGYYLFTLRRK